MKKNPSKFVFESLSHVNPHQFHDFYTFIFYFFMHFCPGTMITYADSINSDLQRGLNRRLRHT